jgi:hypothetical protein
MRQSLSNISDILPAGAWYPLPRLAICRVQQHFAGLPLHVHPPPGGAAASRLPGRPGMERDRSALRAAARAGRHRRPQGHKRRQPGRRSSLRTFVACDCSFQRKDSQFFALEGKYVS